MNIGSIGMAAPQAPQVAHHTQAAPQQNTSAPKGSDSDGDNDGSSAATASAGGTPHALNVKA